MECGDSVSTYLTEDEARQFRRLVRTWNQEARRKGAVKEIDDQWEALNEEAGVSDGISKIARSTLYGYLSDKRRGESKINRMIALPIEIWVRRDLEMAGAIILKQSDPELNEASDANRFAGYFGKVLSSEPLDELVGQYWFYRRPFGDGVIKNSVFRSYFRIYKKDGGYLFEERQNFETPRGRIHKETTHGFVSHDNISYTFVGRSPVSLDASRHTTKIYFLHLLYRNEAHGYGKQVVDAMSGRLMVNSTGPAKSGFFAFYASRIGGSDENEISAIAEKAQTALDINDLPLSVGEVIEDLNRFGDGTAEFQKGKET